MAEEGAVNSALHTEECSGVNQHWLFSLEQFYAEATVAWKKHQERTAVRLGAPAGRISKEGEE
jgi:hypothetical protein